jgi:hypothetical protein
MSMRRTIVKFGVTTAFLLTLLAAGLGATVHAAPPSSGPTPNVPVCTNFIYVDKPTSGVAASNGGYTLKVYVQFLYDGTTRELCFARSKAIIDKGTNNLVGGTLTLRFYNCSTLVDSLTPSVPDGPGAVTYYGNKVGASCGDTTASFRAKNGYLVPSGGGSLDSGNRLA